MIIYKDIFTGDELFSDSFPMELVDDVVYKLKGKMRTESFEVNDSLIGGNASAEGGGDDGGDAATQSGVDVVMNGRLNEYALDKKSYMTHIKEYMKRVKERLQADKPDQVDTFTSKVQAFVKGVLGEFKEYQFFCGESMNPDGMLVLMKWDGETPYLFFFKHGLDEEKC
jgi:hypothetical protein